MRNAVVLTIVLLSGAESYFTNWITKFSYPDKCKPGFCIYEADWFYDKKTDSVTFSITAKVKRGLFAGIGFADELSDPIKDLVTGYLRKDRYHFLLDDGYTNSLKPDKTILDKQQDAVLISMLYQNGKLMYKFNRKRYTGDKYDVSLRNCVFFKFTWEEFKFYKAVKKTIFSEKKVCVGPKPPVDPCKNKYCKVHSHCVHKGHDSKCICNTGYHMIDGHCKSSHEKDPCLFCTQHEFCVKVHGKAECRCKPHYDCENKH